MTRLLIFQSTINTHEFYSRDIVAGFQCLPDAAKSLRSATRNLKCGADNLPLVRLVGHLMLLPDLALTLHQPAKFSTESLKTRGSHKVGLLLCATSPAPLHFRLIKINQFLASGGSADRLLPVCGF